MSVNSLLINDPDKGWANLFVNSLTTFNDLTVKGKLIVGDNTGGGFKTATTTAQGSLIINPITNVTLRYQIVDNIACLLLNPIFISNSNCNASGKFSVILPAELAPLGNSLQLVTVYDPSVASGPNTKVGLAELRTAVGESPGFIEFFNSALEDNFTHASGGNGGTPADLQFTYLVNLA